MAGQQVAGVAVWAHTGRGPHLTSEQRHQVLAAWRAALPGKVIVAGAPRGARARGGEGGGGAGPPPLPRAGAPAAAPTPPAAGGPAVALFPCQARAAVA